MLKIDLIRSVDFSNLVETSINVLGACMLDIVLDMLEGGFGVCVNRCGGVDFEAD